MDRRAFTSGMACGLIAVPLNTMAQAVSTRFRVGCFAINLKTAQVLGLNIPQSLLLRADEVIQ